MSSKEIDIRVMIEEEKELSKQESSQENNSCEKAEEPVALEKHLKRFLDNRFFSPATVTKGLNQAHGHQTAVKGTIISAFNSAHSGNWMCPYGSTEFKADAKTGYAKYLHLGTARIWNAKGKVDEERWERFEKFVTKNQEQVETKIVTQNAVHQYLEFCYANDPQESNTGRNTDSWFSSATVQSFAAKKAWDEVFALLTCGWQETAKPHDYEPFINLKLVRLFFDNTDAALLHADSQELPVAKPKSLMTEEPEEISEIEEAAPESTFSF